jgi:hypothetical protein
MLRAEGYDRLQGQARSGFGFSAFSLLLNRLTEQTLLKP